VSFGTSKPVEKLESEERKKERKKKQSKPTLTGWLFCFLDLAQAWRLPLCASVSRRPYDCFAATRGKEILRRRLSGHREAALVGAWETSMYTHNNTILIIVVTGVAMMLIGFGFRDRNIGMGLMGVGLITAIGTILYKAYITFY